MAKGKELNNVMMPIPNKVTDVIIAFLKWDFSVLILPLYVCLFVETD